MNTQTKQKKETKKEMTTSEAPKTEESTNTTATSSDAQAKKKPSDTKKTKKKKTAKKKKSQSSSQDKKTQKENEKKEKKVKKEKAQPAPIEVDKHEAEGAKWFVIHTYSGHENKVSTNLKQRIETMKLEGKIFHVVVPTRNVVTVQHGKKEQAKEKIYPGYILINMILNDETWLAVRTTPGVTTFVGAGTKPTPISKKEVKVILNYMKLEAPKYKAKFTMGEAVKIIDGPFADFLGTIETIDEEKGKVKVLVSIFGRETPVELDFLQIAKL